MTVQQRGKSAGFTLIEVLLVLALVAVLAGIVAGNASAFILGGSSEPPDRVLKRAVLDALYFSTEKKEEVRLAWSEQQATFLIKDRNGVILKRHSIYEDLDEESVIDEDQVPKVSFFTIPPKVGFGGSSSPLTMKICIWRKSYSMEVTLFLFWLKLNFLEEMKFWNLIRFPDLSCKAKHDC